MKSATFLFSMVLLLSIYSEASNEGAFCISSRTTFYSAANSKSKKLKDLPKNSPVTTTGEKKLSFVQIKDVSGRKGWIRSGKLRSKLNCAAVKKNKVFLRSGPGTQYEQLGFASRGDAFIDHGGEDGWTKVENESGQKFWIQLDSLWKPAKKIRMSFDPK